MHCEILSVKKVGALQVHTSAGWWMDGHCFCASCILHGNSDSHELLLYCPALRFGLSQTHFANNQRDCGNSLLFCSFRNKRTWICGRYLVYRNIHKARTMITDKIEYLYRKHNQKFKNNIYYTILLVAQYSRFSRFLVHF